MTAAGGPVVLVLASGRGERFRASGGHGSKLDALLAGRPVLDHTLAAVRASGLAFHVERSVHAGMGDSIAAAVDATSRAPGWLVLPGDLPLVRPESLRAVARALQASAVVLPMHEGVRGHPVGFRRDCGADLLVLQGAEGAASVVRKRGAAGLTATLPLDDPGIAVDIDTLQDLAAAEELLARRAATDGARAITPA